MSKKEFQINNFILVFFGGLLGGISRIMIFNNNFLYIKNSMVSLFLIDIIGSLVFLIISNRFLNSKSKFINLFLKTGFLGGFTSFSSIISFSYMDDFFDGVSYYFFLILTIIIFSILIKKVGKK